MQTVKTELNWDSSEKPVHVRVGMHKYIIDDPEAAGGSDKAPSALQYFISSLGGCFIGMSRMIAGEMGITLDHVRIRLEGDFELNAVLGKDDSVRPGLQVIRMQMDVKSSAPADKVQALVKQVEKRCPVKNCFDAPVPIALTINQNS